MHLLNVILQVIQMLQYSQTWYEYISITFTLFKSICELIRPKMCIFSSLSLMVPIHAIFEKNTIFYQTYINQKIKHQTLSNFPTCYFIHLQTLPENLTFLSLIVFSFWSIFLVTNTIQPGVGDCEKSHLVRAE